MMSDHSFDPFGELLRMYVQGARSNEVFNRLLDLVLVATGSDAGIVAEFIPDAEEGPAARISSLRGVNYRDSDIGSLLGENDRLPVLNRHVLTVAKTEQPLILKDEPSLAEELRAAGSTSFKEGSFIGIPVLGDDRVIGVIGLAREEAYDESVVASLSEALLVAGTLIDAYQAKAGFQSTEFKYRSLVERVGDAVISMSEKGRITSLNRSALALFGYDEEEIIGKPLTMLMPERYRDAHHAGLQRYLDTLEPKLIGKGEVQVEGMNKGGTEFPISLTLFEIVSHGDRYFSAVIQDPAKTLHDEERLRIYNEMRELISGANAPIMGIDVDGNVTEWNRKAEDITGYAREEVLGRSLVDLLPTDKHRQVLVEIFSEALRGEEKNNCECTIQTKSGDGVDILFSTTAHRDAQGNVTGITCVGQDVTQLKKREAALQNMQKLQTFGQLTGGIAHDFNNLLTVIKGNLDLVHSGLGGSFNATVEEALEDAMKAVNDGSKITRQLLTFTRNEAMTLSRVFINQYLKSQGRLLKRTLGKGIEVKFDFAEENPPIAADESALGTAILNVCINARDAMKGKGRVLFVTRLHRGNPDTVSVTIADQGCGMTRDVLELARTPFFSTKDHTRSSGLGLSMVDGFMAQVGGEMKLESTPGEGTRVILVFKTWEDAGSTRSDEGGNGSDDHAALAKSRILVVDDEPGIRRMAVRFLTQCGCEVVSAANGPEALQVLKENPHVDLLFSDIVMPGGMNGRELAESVRTAYPDIRIVLTTGFDVDEEGGAGDWPVLRKPYAIRELEAFLEKALK